MASLKRFVGAAWIGTKAVAVKKAIQYLGFNCPGLHPSLGFAVTTHASVFGQKLDAQLAKLGA